MITNESQPTLVHGMAPKSGNLQRNAIMALQDDLRNDLSKVRLDNEDIWWCHCEPLGLTLTVFMIKILLPPNLHRLRKCCLPYVPRELT